MYNDTKNLNIQNAAYYSLTYLKNNESSKEKIVETLLLSGLWEYAFSIAIKSNGLESKQDIFKEHNQFNNIDSTTITSLLSPKCLDGDIEKLIQIANPVISNRILYLCLRNRKLRHYLPKIEHKLRIPFYLPLILRKNGYLKAILKENFSASFIRSCELFDSFPFKSFKKNKKLKVAVCLSGQMRNYKNAMKRLKSALADYEVTYFIHTWEKTGGKKAGAMDVHQLSRMTGKNIANKIINNSEGNLDLHTRFPRFFDELSKQIDSKPNITYAELGAEYPNSICVIEDDSDFKATKIDLPVNVNTYKMLYKIYMCDKLRREYENEHGIDFDAVIRIRPDLVVSDKLDLPSIIAERTVATGFIVNRFIDDQIYITTPKTMTVLCDLWVELNQYENLVGREPLISTKSPHNLIWSHFHIKNLNYTIIPVLCWLATEVLNLEELDRALQEDIDSE
ncbi:MAG: hypothetical protein ABJK64_06050 [Paraglaciecola sp.]|uniref:hypothetical protein n=1 Tax=Paraglaciecola sp. TaxID=1920173 RepID=UPI003297645D